MKRLLPLIFLAFLAAGCAHSSSPVSSLSSSDPSFQPLWVMVAVDSGQTPVPPGKSPAPIQSGSEMAGENENVKEEAGAEEEGITIADPLEPFNRAMFQFNDKLYFWVLKPVAQGYNKVTPQQARIGVRNFFNNLRFPIRFVSCLLQADFKCAGTELGRFTVNTSWGVGGLLDPASNEQLDIPKKKADLGQTLGVYGLGHGFYIVWPVLGPSSLRDSVEIGGDYFLYPVNYITPWYDWLGVRAYEVVNDTSLHIGDYESLKSAAIDPYVAIRDAYVQYRKSLVESARGKKAPPKGEGTTLGAPPRY